ncbi:hypothetical protein [Streptomyces sp. NPDC058745]
MHRPDNPLRRRPDQAGFTCVGISDLHAADGTVAYELYALKTTTI